MSNLESFIKYYKECVFEDNSDTIFAFAHKNGYIKIEGDELTNRDPIKFSELEENTIKKFINSTILKTPNPSFWYGFPILYIEKNEKKIIKPLFYIPINYDEEKKPEISNKIYPRINNDAFNDLGIENEQIKRFAEEIKLFEEDNKKDFITIGEKLKEIFPDFKYGSNKSKGILFKGVVFSSEQSKYTQGLDVELNELLRQESSCTKSCLKYYVDPSENIVNQQINKPLSNLLEIFELNENQKKAIELSFENPVTVITGPPGTGKSQVVASLILNSILKNQKVLFASKNHKAIKVVEEKFNNIVGQSFLIRLGKQDNEGNNLKRNLINYLNCLSKAIMPIGIEEDIIKYENLLNQKIDERNKIKDNIEKYRLIRNKTLTYFRKEQNKYNDDCCYQQLLVNIKTSKQIRRKNIFSKKIKNIALYLKNMNEAHKISTFEILLEKVDLYNKEIKELSENYIKLWVKAFPNKFKNNQKTDLNDYIAVLESLMITGLDKKVFNNLTIRRNHLQSKIAEFLNSWCVTNLSIKGEIPLIEGFFDLLIIDEASQCDMASVIPLLYRSKRVVVLGDPFQLRHISTMSKMRSLELLLNYNLHESYNYVTKSFFDISQTIADKSSFVFLNEHFRSHSDIISFSKNYQKWYNGNLLISTDYRRLNPQPKTDNHSIEWIDVSGVIKQINSCGAFIENEVDCVVKKAVEILNDSTFDGEIGIISPFRMQANEIRTKLDHKLDDIKRNRVLVETTVKFQGDEKDIIIFSPVISNEMPKGVRYYLDETDYLLNVAITRARAKLIIVGNKNACLNCEIQHYIDFVKYVEGIVNGTIENIEKKSESIYETILFKAMKDNGIDPIPQYVVGQYRLDFAIIKNSIKIDIEVDGKQYHTDWSGERLKTDIVRNQRLQNLGWEVIRLWSYEIRDDISYCIQRIKEKMPE